MTQHEPAGSIDDSALAGGAVDLVVPSATAYVSIVRTVTAGLAARCDLTLDEIEDLRIAIDEACALLLPIADPNGPLRTHFQLDDGCLVVAASVDSTDGSDRTGTASRGRCSRP